NLVPLWNQGDKQFDVNAGKLNHDKAENALLDSIRQWATPATNTVDSKWGPGAISSLGIVNRTGDGFTVDLSLYTGKQHWAVDTNPSFWKYVRGDILLTFKYAGMADGKEQYVCTDVAGQQVQWVCGAPYRPTEYYPGRLEDFGLGNANMIKAKFTTPNIKDV